MSKIGFQLYSLHAVDDPLPTVLERVGDTLFEGVEFAGLGNTSIDQLRVTLEQTGLQATGAHVGLDELESDVDLIANTYEKLDCENIVVPWLDEEHFQNRERVAEAGDRLDAVAEALAPRGISLHYHNHDQEFADVGGKPAIETLLELTESVGFQLDVGWAGAAGYDPLALLETHADRITTVHLKDYDTVSGETVAVGDGDLIIEEIVETVRASDIEWLIYEAETQPDRYETFTHAESIVEQYW